LIDGFYVRHPAVVLWRVEVRMSSQLLLLKREDVLEEDLGFDSGEITSFV